MHFRLTSNQSSSANIKITLFDEIFGRGLDGKNVSFFLVELYLYHFVLQLSSPDVIAPNTMLLQVGSSHQM